jgi:hypothetical protein
MAIMSFSNAPDARTLGRVAGALAVDEAFVEKDWYVVQAIRTLIGQGNGHIVPIFSGGTSLLKGHELIKRFSEDIDFKLGLSPAFLELSGNQQRKTLGDFKDALVTAWTEAGFTITDVAARDANGFIQVEMAYPSIIDEHDALRPHILAELSAKPPGMPTQERPLSSYVNQYRSLAPEVTEISCVDPVETAADKLSAFTWRMIVRDRASPTDDPTIVRHLHDLAALEPTISANAAFPALLAETLLADSDRGGEIASRLPPVERLSVMLKKLEADTAYADEYDRFVGGMAFAGESEIPSFPAAVQALTRLCARLPR